MSAHTDAWSLQTHREARVSRAWAVVWARDPSACLRPTPYRTQRCPRSALVRPLPPAHPAKGTTLCRDRTRGRALSALAPWVTSAVPPLSGVRGVEAMRRCEAWSSLLCAVPRIWTWRRCVRVVRSRNCFWLWDAAPWLLGSRVGTECGRSMKRVWRTTPQEAHV